MKDKKKCVAFGSFNVRGCQSVFEKQNHLADDMVKYGLEFLAVQEKHIRGTGLVQICSKNQEKTEYTVSNVGTGTEI